jgi:hypothetical protein
MFFFFPTKQRAHCVWLILACGFWLLSGSSLLAAEPAVTSLSPVAEASFPEQLGAIVYQTQAPADSRIYIIANGHRSALDGANMAETVQAQVETFRIGEWLINQKRIDLLLPEGFFGEMGRSAAIAGQMIPLDNRVLVDALTDTTHFVNAEVLLHEKYGIGLQQVEDRALYRNVKERLRSSLNATGRFSFANYTELVQLQKLRTAHLLQAAPTVIAEAYQQGRIAAPNAMLTVGLSHLEDIISFLESGEIDLAGRQTAGRESSLHQADPEPVKPRVGITVVVPRSLISKGFAVRNHSGFGEAPSFTR